MLDLAQIAEKRTPRSFEFDDETVNIELLPHKVTPTYRSKLAALAQKAQAVDGEAEDGVAQVEEQDAKMVADLMPKWDVQVKGEPFPPTYENLLLVPVTLLGRVASEIMEVIKELSNPIRKKKSSK